MPLFAVMEKNTATRIVRIETDKDADEKITRLFKEQYEYFETHYEDSIEYCAGYTPSYNECHFLDGFVEADDLTDAVKRSTAITTWDPTVIPIDNIKALFVGVDFPNDHKKIALQSFNRGQILDVSKSLWLSKSAFKMSTSIGFNVDEKLVATIRGNKIKFKSLQKLRGIFDMDRYFSEATDADIKAFSQHDKFKTEDGFDMSIIADTVIRTKITLINSSGVLNNETSLLKKAAEDVGFELKTYNDNGIEKILIPSTKKEVKLLLTFLDEDIFIAAISKIRFKSNSKRPMK